MAGKLLPMNPTRQRRIAFKVLTERTAERFMESKLAGNTYWEYTKCSPMENEEKKR